MTSEEQHNRFDLERKDLDSKLFSSCIYVVNKVLWYAAVSSMEAKF